MSFPELEIEDDEPEESDDQESFGWHGNLITAKHRKEWIARRNTLLQQLLSAARASSDSAVIALACRVEEVDLTVSMLGGRRIAEEMERWTK